MNQPATYLWLPAYTSAVLEADDSLLSTRIYEALAAIERRRPNLIATDGIEERAMEDAQRGLLTLKAERLKDENPPERTRMSHAGQRSEGTC